MVTGFSLDGGEKGHAVELVIYRILHAFPTYLYRMMVNHESAASALVNDRVQVRWDFPYHTGSLGFPSHGFCWTIEVSFVIFIYTWNLVTFTINPFNRKAVCWSYFAKDLVKFKIACRFHHPRGSVTSIELGFFQQT